MRAALAAVATACILILAAAGCGDSGAAVDGTTTTAVRAPKEFFGIVPQDPVTPEDLDRMQQGDVGTIRFVVPWGAIDTTAEDAPLDFAGLDAVVLGAAEHGIAPLPMIYGTPTWVAEDLDHDHCDPNCGAYAPRSPEALATWKQFVGALVDRYGPDGDLWADNPDVDPQPIRSWQIWNEQNSPTFYQPKVDPTAYAGLLEAASDAIKARDPGAEVILGGMFGTPFKGKPPAISAPEFLRDLYALDGARDDFDAVAAHPYAARAPKIEQQVRLLHDEIDRAGDDAALWITEVGASSGDGSECRQPCPLERGPEGQAQLLREAFELFLAKRQAWKIEGVTWYAWRDTSDPNQCDWCHGAGLFAEDSLEPKPAWQTFLSFSGGS